MALYAIADLHLSNSTDKPMDIFGSHWFLHHEKIKENWCNNVAIEDTVLIAGDISWAMNIEAAKADLNWINQLPGKKILIKGNHDFWWSSITSLNSLYEDIHFLQNNFYTYEDYAICGTRGWLSPNKTKFTQQDEKIYQREVHRLILSLEAAKKEGYSKIIVMLHYPPTNEDFEASLFTKTLEEYNVERVIYGHLHGVDSFKAGLQGIHRGVEYHLVSCDYLDFKLLKLISL
ncbi:serine/threonine protein phosphatase [Alkaliphilus pronyensis]|uniref:Serine/threonine protein phosphatase n=1 Tax=Alkaliphilus pronyensis TaxID=1482732 RepID=A0A6I0F2C1_9FIRM|nr:metallophosphoesterase [Alkaliphilus pronyensis]KAB3531627.1 serine/threonine protein phosphatase [Alkaliphilus pronyensis]